MRATEARGVLVASDLLSWHRAPGKNGWTRGSGSRPGQVQDTAGSVGTHLLLAIGRHLRDNS
eukprot:15451030-Alexandrium_andersonii.AAC.1